MGKVQSLIDAGSGGLIITVECNLSNNLPHIVIVGYGNRAVDEARERVRGAFMSSRLQLPRKRITINLAPADVPKDGSSFDLAIAAAIMQASGAYPRDFQANQAILGELGLDGSVRPVRGVIGKLLAGRSHGLTNFFIPQANLAQALLVPHIEVMAVSRLGDLHRHLLADPPLEIATSGSSSHRAAKPRSQQIFLSDIVGQVQAKRALEIAAAGGHNLLLSGPPGTGKSMLAWALPSLLPAMSNDEKLEVTQLHSLASKQYEQIITERPFRAPHHSASHVAIIGGGQSLKPGEISLAHRGVLFLDELPEFKRSTIEVLRQPLEDRVISVSRARDSVEYPANCIVVATANPCPCGYYGTPKPCICSGAAIQHYRQKLSGPILDRIDLYCAVHEVDHANLLSAASTDDSTVHRRIAQARTRQRKRCGSGRLNAALSNRDIKRYAGVSNEAKSLLDSAAANLQLSARAYLRTVKVARTIADLAGSDGTELLHVTEALQYRWRN